MILPSVVHGYAFMPINVSNVTNDTIGIESANTPLRDVLADGPWRVEPGQTQFPLYLFVKDADEITYGLDHIEAYADANNDGIYEVYVKNNYYGQIFSALKYPGFYTYGDWHDTILLPTSGLDENGVFYNFNGAGKVKFQVSIKGLRPLLDPDVDSYFSVYFASDPMPKLTSWFAGDTHYHSSYSDNFVEIGAPIDTVVEMGKRIGLDWTVITDHSFDLDDTYPLDTQDAKWDSLKSDVGAVNDPAFKIILGEEISAGNGHTNPLFPIYDSENVHLLCYNLISLDSFIQGDGDDRWDHKLSTYPTISLQNAITQCLSAGGIAYAAHPGAVTDATQYWLNRGRWYEDNVEQLQTLQGFTGLQIWNTIRDPWSFFEEGKALWLNQLKEGRKSYISAGSDAHGDFSNASYLQPKKQWDAGDVVYHNSTFGSVRTYVYSPSGLTENGILEGLKYGHSIMTDGPLVVFDVDGTVIGDTRTINYGDSITLSIEWLSTEEFGRVDKIRVIEGDLVAKKENSYEYTVGSLSGNKQLTFYPLGPSYYRLEATTNKGKKAYTNPIWVEVEGSPYVPCDYCPLPDTTAPTIYNTRHDPATPSSSDSIHVYADIIDDTSVSSAVVWYTTDGSNWQSIPLTNVEGDTWRTITPISAQQSGTEIQYTVCATDGSGNNACEEQAVCPLSQELAGIMEREWNASLEIDLGRTFRLSADAEYYSSQEACSIGVHTIIVGIVDNTPPPAPSLYDPGATLNEGEYYVMWSNVGDAESGVKHYELQESNTPSFQTTSYYTAATSYLITGKESGTYYYRVRAVDNADNPSSWSNTEDVNVDIPPPSEPEPPAPSWSAIDSFDDESGTAYGNGWTWGDWRYEELLDDGVDNYVKKVSSYEGHSGVGLFYWGTTLGDTAPQAVIKENPSGWDFSYSEGEWAVMMNNQGPWDEYVQLYFWDVNGREAATYLQGSERGAGWEQLVWDSSLILYQAMDANISMMEIPEGAIVAQAGFLWNNVAKVKLWVEKSRYEEITRELYFDDFAWNMDAYLEASRYYPEVGESYSLTLYAQNTLAEQVTMVFSLDGENKFYTNVPAYESRSFTVTRSKAAIGDYTYQGTVYLNPTSGAEQVVKKSNPVTVSVVDTTRPSVSIDAPAEGEVVRTSSVIAEWSGSDSGTGIARYEVQLDAGGWVDKGGETNHVFTSVADGVHTLYVKAIDGAGNTATASRSFTLDANAPEAPKAVATPGGWTSQDSVTISWGEVYDALGIERYEYQIDDVAGAWTSVGLEKTFTTPAMPSGVHVAYVRAVDKTGNEGSIGSASFYLDVDNPTGRVEIGADYTKTRNVSLTLGYEDVGSGVAYVRLSNDGVWDTETWEAPAETREWALSSGDGEKRVYYQVVDKVGRLSATYEDSVFLDGTAPIVEEVWHSPGEPTNYDEITVYASIFDVSSVEARLLYSLDGSSWTEAEMALNASGQIALEGQQGLKKEKGKPKGKKKFVVKRKKGKKVSKGEIEKAKGKKVKEVAELEIDIIETASPGEFKKKMKKHKDVEYVEEAMVLEALEVPADEYYPEQWNMQNIRAEEAWNHSKGEGVVVAVIDTGVDYTHEDLNDNYVGGYDFVNDDTDAMDDNGHGTHVAGIIAGEMDGRGVVGVAPGAKILALKALDTSGMGYDYQVAQAIVYAADHGAGIISMSLGGGYSRVLEEAAEYARGKGLLLIAAAGNTKGSVLYPAALESVVAVSATDQDNTLAGYSSYGDEVEVAAPGGGEVAIISTSLGNTYGRKIGTSMATAHVSGVAALAEAARGSKGEELRAVLREAVDDLGFPGKDDFYGYGLINAAKAVNASIGAPAGNGSTNPGWNITFAPSAQTLRVYYAKIGPINADQVYYQISATDAFGSSTIDDNQGMLYNISISSKIKITSPENKTYARDSLPLIYNISVPTVWEGYSLDGGENVTSGGAITSFADGATAKNLSYSTSNQEETVYIRVPKNATVVGIPSVTLRGYSISTSFEEGDEGQYPISTGDYVLIKEFIISAKQDYRSVIEKVRQELAVNDVSANATGRIAYQVDGGEEVIAFEDVSWGSIEAVLFEHGVSWSTGYEEDITVRFYLKVSAPEVGSAMPQQAQAVSCAAFPEPVGQAITKNSWVGSFASAGGTIWIGLNVDWSQPRGAHWIYEVRDGGVVPWGAYINDANFNMESWATCEELQVGKASFSSTPSGAQIWIDGSSTGKVTPATVDNLAVGEHSYVLKLSGYADYTGTFSVAGGKTTEISATLTPLKGSASFSSEPSGAQIWIDGSSTGKVTPATVDNLAPGEHSYVLKLQGYKEYSGSFSIVGGQVTYLSTAVLTPFTAYLSGLGIEGIEASTYPRDVRIDTGGDSVSEVELAGELNYVVYDVDLDREAFNDYISKSSADENGYVMVPLKISSQATGILELSSLYINYRHNITLANLSDGGHRVKVHSKSVEGSLDYREVYFSIDTAPLSLIIISPANGSTYNMSEVELNYSLSKPAMWIGYSLDNATNVTLLGNTTLTNLTHGEHVLIVYANDTLGNLAYNSSRFSVVLDNIAPSIELLSPLNGSFIRSGMLIDLNITDNIAVHSAWYSWNATNVTLLQPYDINTSGWGEGEAAVSVWANDSAGNLNHTAYYFTVDATPPVTMDDAPEGWMNADFAIALVADDSPSGVAYTRYRRDNGTWMDGTAITIDTEGNHSIEYYSVDNADNIEEIKTVYAALDKTPPNITIIGVANGSYYNVDVSITVNISDANLNSSVATLDDLPYISGTPISDEGEHVLEVYAIDHAGNNAAIALFFTIDNTPPEVNITSPLDEFFVRGIVEIAGVVTDINLEAVSLSIDGIEIANALPYSWDTLNYSDGAHIIELAVADKAGNTASVSVMVYVDNTPASITITSPANKAYLNSVVNITGSAEDINLVNVSLRIDDVEVSSSLPYSWDTAKYTDGEHAVELFAIDKAGNSASTSISVTVDNTLPSIATQYPDKIADYMQFEINATILDANLENVTFLLNSTPIAYNVSGDTYTSQCIGAFGKDSVLNFKITAGDKAGNIAREEFNLTVLAGEVKIEGKGKLKEENRSIKLELEAKWKKGKAKGEVQLQEKTGEKEEKDRFKAHGKIDTLYKDCSGVFRISGVAKVERGEGKDKEKERNVTFTGAITENEIRISINGKEFVVPAKINIKERIEKK